MWQRIPRKFWFGTLFLTPETFCLFSNQHILNFLFYFWVENGPSCIVFVFTYRLVLTIQLWTYIGVTLGLTLGLYMLAFFGDTFLVTCGRLLPDNNFFLTWYLKWPNLRFIGKFQKTAIKPLILLDMTKNFLCKVVGLQ